MDRLAREDSIRHALPWCIAALGLGLCLWAAQTGSQMNADRELGDEQALAVETEDVCARLGAPARSPEFVACAIELDGVRQRERERTAARESGLP